MTKISERDQEIAEQIADALASKTNERLDEMESRQIEFGKELKKRGEGTIMASLGVTNELASILKKSENSFKDLLSGAARAVKISLPIAVIKDAIARANVSGSTRSHRLNSVGQLDAGHTNLFQSLFGFIPLGLNTGGKVTYLDVASVVRGADTVAESASKPESELEFSEHAMTPTKIADIAVLTKEFMVDYNLLVPEVERFLRTNVALKLESELYSGDGTGTHMRGILESATPYAGYSGPAIENPNLYDLVIMLKAQMLASAGGKYRPNFIAIHPITSAALRLVKTTIDGYAVPLVSAESNELLGLKLIESPLVGVDELVIGDASFGSIYTIGGIEVDFGYYANLWKENKVGMLVEVRAGLLIRAVDSAGFIHVESIEEAVAGLVGGS
ncbi:MAG TPA: phage major capsid protein [Chryseolinea sp.]|nr:phage major capsid protein [Chryseolinea sp.]